MRDELISEVVQRMLPYLDNKQLADLQSNLNQVLQRYDVELIKGDNTENDSQEWLLCMYINLCMAIISCRPLQGLAESLKIKKAVL